MAVDLVKQSTIPWCHQYGCDISDIKELLSRYWLVQLDHTLREANGVTDHLAKKGAQGTYELWTTMPTRPHYSIRNLIWNDIRFMATDIDKPWIVMEDFNVVASIKKWKGVAIFDKCVYGVSWMFGKNYEDVPELMQRFGMLSVTLVAMKPLERMVFKPFSTITIWSRPWVVEEEGFYHSQDNLLNWKLRARWGG
ncbi:unnamed protein product [Lupinus luteus]|uniref:RNase H type-1 domain-containing protein n=1 Tax=Lupinus luteus TaxID=3873 RepID=A0AAV1WFN7_LUPLU